MIGDEGREAYNSLIERKSSLSGIVDGLSPAATLLRHLDTNEFAEITGVRTLPRRSVHDCLMEKLQQQHQQHQQRQQLHNQQQQQHHNNQQAAEVPTASVPVQHAPRPMTLPSRISLSAQMRKAASDFLRGGGGGGGSGDVTPTDEGKENNNNNRQPLQQGFNGNGSVDGQQLSPCESPSYLTHTFYKFPPDGGDQSPHAGSPTPVSSPTDMTVDNGGGGGDSNPIPLPPRDGKKHIKTNAKRHVRRYPLIIPASGVQRTLSKVTDATPTDDDEENNEAGQTRAGLIAGSPAAEKRTTVEMVASVRPAAVRNSLQDVQAQLREQAAAEAASHTYQNLEEVAKMANGGGGDAQGRHDVSLDSASMQFESILESSQGHTLQSPDVTDGFYNFSIQKEHYHKDKDVSGLLDSSKMSGLYVNEDELRNLDIESASMKMAAVAAAGNTTLTTSATASVAGSTSAHSNGNSPTQSISVGGRGTPTSAADNQAATSAENSTNDRAGQRLSSALGVDNELAGNALFKRVRQSVETAMGSRRTPSPATSAVQHHTATFVGGGDGSAGQKSSNRRPQTEAEYFAATAARLASSNSVSCEDLLEFADKKPKGCERGVDSDEVRIMMKVLGKDATPNRCLHVLEFIDWDVHKAIKIIRLQNILTTMDLNLSESVEVLQENEWDLHTTALKLKGLKV